MLFGPHLDAAGQHVVVALDNAEQHGLLILTAPVFAADRGRQQMTNGKFFLTLACKCE